MNLKYLLYSVILLLPALADAQPCNQTLTASFSPATVCSGKDVNLFASNIPGAAYSWTGPSFSSNVRNPTIPSIALAGAGVYTVTATAGACTYTASVTVNVTLTPTVTSVSNNGPVCPNHTVTLSATSNGAAGVSYNWSGPNGYTYSSTNNTAPVNNVQPINAGIYDVYVETPDGCVSDPKNTTVSVYPKIKADFNFAVKELCDGKDNVTFTDASTGNTSSAWDFGDQTQGNGTTVVHSYPNQPTPPAAKTPFTVTLIASNANCADTIQKTILIGHPLKADFVVDDDSICQHTKVSFTDKSIITPATAPAEFWDFGDGATDNTQLATSHTYDRSGVYNAKFVITDYIGCKDSLMKTIVVDSFGFITFNSSEDKLCLGKDVQFVGDYSPQGLLSAIWDLDDGNTLNGIKNIVHGYDKAGTYHVSFSAHYRICPDAKFEKDITIVPHPVIDLGPDRTMCPNGNPISLADKINKDNPLAKWQWNTETVNKGSSLTVYNIGTYAATVTIDGCSSTDSVEIKKSCYIDIPNAFTPNGDGVDDYFLSKELLSKGLTKFNMSIFNRWGQVIFKTDNTSGRGWDGKFNGEPQSTGVYVYMIEASFLNGQSEKYQGDVTLLR